MNNCLGKGERKNKHGKAALKCNVCSYKWVPNSDNPQRCPKCRSSRWDSNDLRKNICNLCGHNWISSNKTPSKCPSCHSTKWNLHSMSLKCKKCGHAWMKRGERLPARCPACRSENWREYSKRKSLVSVDPTQYLDNFINRHVRFADVFRVLFEDMNEEEKIKAIQEILDIGDEELRIYLRYLEGLDLVTLSISYNIPFQSAVDIIQDTTLKIYSSYGPGVKA